MSRRRLVVSVLTSVDCYDEGPIDPGVTPHGE